MFDWFSRDPSKKLQKEYERTLSEAMLAQRNGDIKRFAVLSEEAHQLLEQLQVLAAKKPPTF